MSEMNATPATEAATSETQDFLLSVGESEKRVRVSGRAVSDEVVLSTKDVNVYYGDHHALHDTSLDFHKGEITALILSLIHISSQLAWALNCRTSRGSTNM